MYGAILGDIIGSPYEFDRGAKIKAFPLFIEKSRFTDDTVMTIAVADALLILSILVDTLNSYKEDSYAAIGRAA